jgi:hypothetical protein
MPVAAGGGSSSLVSRTMPVTPSVMATPNAMSAMSALRSVSSASFVVGVLLKSLFEPSAYAPKMVPTMAAAPAIPIVT